MIRPILCSAVVLAFALAAPAAAQPKVAGSRPADSDLQRRVVAETDSLLRSATDADKKTLRGLADKAAALLLQTAAWARAADEPAIVEADWVCRALEMAVEADAAVRARVLPVLAANPPLAREVSLLAAPEDDAAGVYTVLARLLESDKDGALAHPQLTAAIAVVYDRPHAIAASIDRSAAPRRRTSTADGEQPGGAGGKEGPKRIDPADVFRYFTRADSQLLFSTRDTPAELLIFMVETTAAPDELAWALSKHAGDRNVGQRYKDIVYDTATYKFNAKPKLAGHPYTLQNIRTYGGICIDQAYYAAHVARAIGDPAVIVTGRQSDEGHAWVGFLQTRSGDALWNFDSGKYDEYEKVRGSTADPQTGRVMSEGELEMIARAAAAPPESRRIAAACADAAVRFQRAERTKRDWPPAAPAGVDPRQLRPQALPLTSEGRLTLLTTAYSASPADPGVWWTLSRWSGELSPAERENWFQALRAQTGTASLDFSFDVTAALIAGVDDPAAQSRAWDWAFGQYPRRPDLAAECRLRQGKLWAKAGDNGKAFDAYKAVVERFPNDGTAVVDALVALEQLLKKGGHPESVVGVYQDAFRRISRPDSNSRGAFRSSNFFRVGTRYAAALEAAGRKADAERVRKQLSRGDD